MKIQAIIPELMVDDVAESIKFYQKYLGFTINMAVPDKDNPIWVMLKNGSTSLMLYHRSEFTNELPQLKDQKLGGSFLLYLRVENIGKLYTQLKNKVSIVQSLHSTDYGQTEFVALVTESRARNGKVEVK